MKLENIFHPVSYPVSRNTPTLGNLVSWNHSEAQKFVDGNGDNIVKELVIDVTTKYYANIVGDHQDKEVVLPTSTYLVGTVLKRLLYFLLKQDKMHSVVKKWDQEQV